jgi:hypothetical protein
MAEAMCESCRKPSSQLTGIYIANSNEYTMQTLIELSTKLITGFQLMKGNLSFWAPLTPAASFNCW